MKRVRKKSYLILGLIVFIIAAVVLTLVILSFVNGTVEEKSRVWMIVTAVVSGVVGLSGLGSIIWFFAKTYPVQENLEIK